MLAGIVVAAPARNVSGRRIGDLHHVRCVSTHGHPGQRDFLVELLVGL